MVTMIFSLLRWAPRTRLLALAGAMACSVIHAQTTMASAAASGRDFIVAVVDTVPITNHEVNARVAQMRQQLTQQGRNVPETATLMRDALERSNISSRVMSAIPMSGVVEHYDRRSAIRFLNAGEVVIFSAGTGNPFFTTDSAACSSRDARPAAASPARTQPGREAANGGMRATASAADAALEAHVLAAGPEQDAALLRLFAAIEGRRLQLYGPTRIGHSAMHVRLPPVR